MLLRHIALVGLLSTLEKLCFAENLRGTRELLGDLSQSPLFSTKDYEASLGGTTIVTLPQEDEAENRIVGGFPADSAKSSFFVMTLSNLSDSNPPGQFRGCGATLVSNCAAVCAAHCGRITGVMVGAHAFRAQDATPQLIEPYHVTAVETIFNEAYDERTNEGDLSILVFEQCMTDAQMAEISPAQIPGDKFQYVLGEPTDVYGFGRTSENDVRENGKYVEELQQVTVPFFPFEQCRQYFGTNQLKPDMVCAGALEGGKDACIGDSGGPAILWRNDIPYLVGATSWGVGCARRNYPGVYASTRFHVDWLEKIICNDPRAATTNLEICGATPSVFSNEGNCDLLGGGEICTAYDGSECCSGVCETPRTGGITRTCRKVSSGALPDDGGRGRGGNNGRGGSAGGGGMGGAGGGRRSLVEDEGVSSDVQTRRVNDAVA